MISAADFGKPHLNNSEVTFGVHPAALAAGLRKLAGEIEEGKVAINSVEVRGKVEANEWFLTTLEIVMFPGFTGAEGNFMVQPGHDAIMA